MNKTKTIKFRISDEEEKIVVCDNGIIYKLNSAVRSIGNNINQIARVANSTGSVSKKDIADIQNNYTVLQNKISEITGGQIPT